jgi:hypothetical protein
MPTVRITTDWGRRDQMEWAGAPAIDKEGRIERSLDIPEEAYQGIEGAIRKGYVEGNVYLKDKSRFSWFLDR